MKKSLFMMISLVCCALLFFSSAFAEETEAEPSRDYESAMWSAIDYWDLLTERYDDQLTNQQKFVAHYYFTDAIQNAHEGNFAMIDTINACDSLEDYVRILNDGVIYPDTPCVPEPEILKKVSEIFQAAGIQQPEHIFVLHLCSESRGHAWEISCGHLGLRTYENGDEFIEPFIDYKLTIEGEDQHLVMFADTDIINEGLISIRY